MREKRCTALKRVNLELNRSLMPDAEFQKGTLLLSFSAHIALLYFKRASKETGFIRENEHTQMKCDTGIHQAPSVLLRQTIISNLSRTWGEEGLVL